METLEKLREEITQFANRHSPADRVEILDELRLFTQKDFVRRWIRKENPQQIKELEALLSEEEDLGNERSELRTSTSKDEQIKKLKNAYDAFDSLKPGEQIEIGDIRELVSSSDGALQRAFPLPKNQSLGKRQGFGLDSKSSSVFLTLKRGRNGEMILIFTHYTKEGKKQTANAYYIEKEKKLISEQKFQIQALKQAYQKFKSLERGKTIPIENINKLVFLSRSASALLQTFPLPPNGEPLGKVQNIGLPQNLSSVSLTLRKGEDDKMIFIFTGVTKEKKETRSGFISCCK